VNEDIQIQSNLVRGEVNLELAWQPIELRDGLVEYHIKSGRLEIELPRFKQTSSKILKVLFTLEKTTSFVWIQGEKLVINTDKKTDLGDY